MATPITPDLLKRYFKEDHKHAAYEETVKKMKALRVHADGDYPHDLIDTRRPSEDDHILTYRKRIFEAVTKETVARIISCLMKIRRSTDWSIKYDEKTFDKSITEDELPDKYFEEKFPVFASLTKWTFDVCLRNYLIDANAVIAVMPLEINVPTNEYLKPFPVVYYSDQVLEYVQDDYCIIKSYDQATWTDSMGVTRHEGDVFYVINTEFIARYEQVNEKTDVAEVWNYPHQLGYMPLFKTAGSYCRSMDRTFIWESRIFPIVPRLNKAIREDNDLDVSVVRHLFPEKWEYVSSDCPKCSGKGKILVEGEVSECKHCKGLGKVVSSPFQTHIVQPALLDQQQVPVPPAGYIVKDVEIIKLQDMRIENHILKALSALNLEFLSKTPIAESGIAKRYDSEESSNFVHSVAEDLVGIMDKIYKIGYDYRYQVRVSDPVKRKAMLPLVNVPDNFNMLPVAYLVEEYSAAKLAKMNPVILNKMEQEIATKRFISDQDVAEELLCILRLDPFAGMTADDKLGNAQFMAKLDSIISTNIQQFVRRAKFENDDFYQWELDKQQELMIEYAKEKDTEISASEKLKIQMAQEAMGEGDTASGAEGDETTEENAGIGDDMENQSAS